mgnify:CR=1 FL=1
MIITAAIRNARNNIVIDGVDKVDDDSSSEEKEELNLKILELHGQGKSLRAIADALGTNHMKVQRLIDKQ